MKSLVRIIEIPWTGSLLEPSSDAFQRSLSDVLDSAKPDEVIIFRFVGDCHDYSNSWLYHLNNESLWSDLFIRMSRWHDLILRILASNAKLLIMADGDVIGTWWELSLAMHGRILTNPYAKVGLPEVYLDQVPPLGILGLLDYDAYNGPSPLRKNAILHAKDAFKLGLVDLCLLSNDWGSQAGLEQLSHWCRHHRRKKIVKTSFLSEYQSYIPAFSAIEENRASPKARLSWFNSIRVDVGCDLFRIKNARSKAIKYAEMRAACAMRLLMPDHLSWLSRRVARYRHGTHDKWWTGSSDLITIDISDGLPPQEIINTFLNRKKRIIFIANNPEALRSGLESMRSRFNKSDQPGKAAFTLWETNVHWICGAIAKYEGIVCQFHFDDTVDFRIGETTQKYFRIAGNFGHAGKGWYEDLSGQKNVTGDDLLKIEEIHETLDLISNGVLSPSKSLPSQTSFDTPITVLLRFILLEYLLCLSARIPNCKSVLELLKLLGEFGWGYASDPYLWESLLKAHREQINDFRSIILNVLKRPNFLNIDSLANMFDHQINSASNEPPLEFRSSAAITRLLEALSSQIAQWLFSNGYVESPEHADLFVTLAWGYPSLLPLPHSLDDKLGPGRLQHWGAGRGGMNQPSVDSATLTLP